MKSIFKFLSKSVIVTVLLYGVIIVLQSNRGNLRQGKESVDITWCQYINISDSSYIDVQAPERNHQASFKGVRIFNELADTTSILCRPVGNTDTMRIILAPLSWSPIVFADFYQMAGKADSIKLIGK